MTTELTPQKIREAGGIVHSDGNVFFTRAAQVQALIDSAIAAYRAARISEYPALPEPDHATVSPWDKDATQMVFFTADQMRAYAAQAVEADRAARGVPDEMDAVAAQYAHKLALDLECVLADYSGTWWDAAIKTIGDYRSAMNAIHERESPTFMGEPRI